MTNWRMFNGWSCSRGVSPIDLRYSDFCDLVYFWLSENKDKKEQDELDTALETPPASEIQSVEYDAPGWSREEQMAAFDAWI